MDKLQTKKLIQYHRRHDLAGIERSELYAGVGIAQAKN